LATHISNSIIKFADDTTVVGLITNNNEIAYREEGPDGVVAGKYPLPQRQQNKRADRGLQETAEGARPPIHIDGTAVDKVESVEFLSVYIANNLK
jgi:hypothetical protein